MDTLTYYIVNISKLNANILIQYENFHIDANIHNMLEKGNYMRNYNFDTDYVEDDVFSSTKNKGSYLDLLDFDGI